MWRFQLYCILNAFFILETKNASEATELEDKNPESVTTAENTERSRLAYVHGIEETCISLQEASLTER